MAEVICYCGCPFSMPDALYIEHKRIGTKIFCPNGHSVNYGESETDILRRERDRLKQQNARLDDERRAAELAKERAQTETKKVRKRAQAALCPCCNRHFNNVEAHMKKKHPEVVKLPERNLS